MYHTKNALKGLSPTCLCFGAKELHILTKATWSYSGRTGAKIHIFCLLDLIMFYYIILHEPNKSPRRKLSSQKVILI